MRLRRAVGFFAMAVTTTCVHLVGAPIRVCAVHEVLHGGTTARPIERTSVAGYMRGVGLRGLACGSPCHVGICEHDTRQALALGDETRALKQSARSAAARATEQGAGRAPFNYDHYCRADDARLRGDRGAKARAGPSRRAARRAAQHDSIRWQDSAN